jgi:hydroxymethylbilane synthase
MIVLLRIATRSSPLALWQANHIADRIRSLDPSLLVKLVEIQTTGDRDRDAPLAQIGGQGVFTKEIQRALLDRRADIAVHSLKDLPTVAIEGLVLAAVPQRGPTGDALVSKRHRSFSELPASAKVATSSQRRRAQVLHRRPDLRMVEIRGNVETRLNKLVAEDLDAIILAQAGLERLGVSHHVTEILDPAWMLPAVGQGALGLECRAKSEGCRLLLEKLDDPVTRHVVLAERAMLRGLGGGCQLPIGAAGSAAGGVLHLRGVVLSPDGKSRIEESVRGPLEDAEALGQSLAEMLLLRDAGRLLNSR